MSSEPRTYNRVIVGLVTHTGRPIQYGFYDFVYRCGGMSASRKALFEHRPGMTRQMARMIAKAIARSRKREVPSA